MVLGIIGESCTGKSTLVESLQEHLELTEYSGKDYLRFATNEKMAKMKFKTHLDQTTNDETIVYTITEKEHLSLLPEDAVKICMKADLNTIKERFKNRMHGNLPKPVEQMIERKHGMFDDVECDIVLNDSEIKTQTSIVLEYLSENSE